MKQDDLSLLLGEEKALTKSFFEPSRLKQKRFDIGIQIGKGTWAKVYRAVDRTNGQLGAVKIYEPTTIARKQMRKRDLNLRDVVLRETHMGQEPFDHIIQRHFCEDGDGEPFIWMPGDFESLANNRSLRPDYRLGDGSPEDTRRELGALIYLYKGLARGLAEMHTVMGRVHGDLSPDNVLISLPEADNLTIGDLGSSLEILRDLFPEDSVYSRVGHWSIRAPELYLAGSRPTTQSDIFSFGATLLQDMVQMAPYESKFGDRRTGSESRPSAPKRPEEIMLGLRERDAQEGLRETLEAVPLPPEVRVMLEQCLAYDPQKRFRDGKELEEEMKALHEVFGIDLEKDVEPPLQATDSCLDEH